MKYPVWPDEMQRYLKLKVEKDGGQAEFRKRHHLGKGELSEMLKGVRPISEKVASIFGYERRTVYVKPNPWGRE